MNQPPPETVVESRAAFDGRLIQVRVDTVKLADGRTTTREIADHPGAVAIVVADAGGRVGLVRQWRSAVGDWTREIPAGTREPNEPADACARRELSEEMDLKAENWSHLVDVYTSPGWSNELIQIFLAQGLAEAPGEPDADETIQTEWVDAGAIVDLISRGEIRDAKSVAGLLAYLCRIRGG